MRLLAYAAALPLLCAAGADYPAGKTILQQVDRNVSSTNRIFTSRMVVHGRRGARTIGSKSWAEGESKSFTEYLSPSREQGTKMLKLDDRLWLYSPSTDRTIQISGHMLRQSVMGSDLSYEDMMEDQRLSEIYDAEVTGLDPIGGRPCWTLALTAVRQDVAYASRKLWVDQERNIPLKEELYAKSGKLLKRTELKDVTRIDGRWFPTRILFKDMLKRGQGTEFVIESIQFDQPIPPATFTKASLRR